MNLLLAAVLLVQDKSAEETFRNIEEQVVRAKTISLSYRTEVQATRDGEARKQGEMSGTLLLKGEGLARLETRMTREGRVPEDSLLVCDGAKASSVERKQVHTLDAPNDLRARLNYLVTRGGVFMSLMMFRQAPRGPNGERPAVFDLNGLTKLSEFKVTDAEGGAKVLHYRITPTFQAEPMKVALHFQPDSYKVIKREVRWKSTDEQVTVTESYSEFALNADIPDEKFKLLVEKK